MAKDLTYIDLFAGCGGLSLGLHHAGWKGLFAIEKSPDAFATLKYNLIDNKNHFDWPAWIRKRPYDIRTFVTNHEHNLLSLRGKVDMITGGPPCQGFSTAGKRNEEDKRNQLIQFYLRFVDLVKPKIIFFENVKGFTMEFNRANKEKGKTYSIYVLEQLDKIGYDVCGDIVDFSEFGIPQKRNRFILVGIRRDVAKEKKIAAEHFFEKVKSSKKEFLISRNLSINVNLEEAISDLLMANGTRPSPDTHGFKAGMYSSPLSNYQQFLRQGLPKGAIADSHRFVNHSQNVKERFSEILRIAARNTTLSNELKEFFGLKKRTTVPLAKDEATPTLTTLPDDYIHYKEPRILTVREYARIQSFPDSFDFKGKYTTGGKKRVIEVPRYTQIGNAVPPLFSEQSGLILKQLV